MGWIEGMLSGFTERKGVVEAENLRQAELSAAREGKIFESLSKSDDPEIRALAITGLLDSAQPRKRKGGLRGWIGEMESSPHLERVRAMINTPVEEETPIHGPQALEGYIPQPPPAVGGAAMPQGNAVEPGQPQVTPLMPDVRMPTGQGPVIGTERTSRPRTIFRSPEEEMLATRRAQSQGDVEGEVAGLIAAGYGEAEARELVKQNYLNKSLSGVGQSYGEGNIVEDPNSPTGYSQVLYLRANPSITHSIPSQPPGFVTQSRGATKEAIASKLFPGKRYGQLTPQEAARVDAEEQTYLQTSNAARALGTEQGQFQAPIDVSTAQRTGTQVGASSAQYSGQAVPTAQQNTRRTTAEDIKTQLTKIKGLLGPLPKQSDLVGGMLPGAMMAYRQRHPDYRVPLASLTSAINNIRASLTRTMQANVGTETERDAERALSTIADFEGRLLDPAKGDTQESAAARIDETLLYLEEVLKSMPAAPVPSSPAVGAPPQPPGAGAQSSGAGPTGYTVADDGTLLLNGQPVP